MIPKDQQAAFIAANRQLLDQAPVPRVVPVINKLNRLVSGGIAMTPGGRLWATWLQHGETRFSYPLAAYSDDDGQSWSGPVFAVETGPLANGMRRTSLCANFWTAPDGRLFWIYDSSLGFFDGEAGVWISICQNPDDPEPVWGEPRRIWHGHAINKPLVRANGEWLLAISLWTYPRDDMFGIEHPCVVGFDELEAERRVHIFASADHGQSWQRRGGIRVKEWSFNEPNLVERKDGSLHMYLRTAAGLAETDSFDHGFSWTPYQPSAIEAPPARIFVQTLQSGAWLAVRHAVEPGKEPKRQKLTAYLSDDEGKTWSDGLRIDDRFGISYPDGFQAPDGRIFVCYDRMRSDGEFLLAVFREADVRAGKAVSPDCAFARPIYRLPGFNNISDDNFVRLKLIENQ